jgi:pSer/pThr/pTyr-binding forkhead associated (FHA) protein
MPLRLSIRNERTSASEDVLVERPWAVIGGDARCDIHLPHPDVSQRHAYLQIVDSRILCCDLGSRTGTHASREIRARSWMTAREPVYVGPYSVRPSDNEFVPLGKCDATEIAAGAPPTDRPPAFLYVANADNPAGRPKVFRIKQPVTLVGWSQTCNLRLRHSTVGRVHCSLVWTPAGLWVVDLLGPEGTSVNDGLVEFACLEEGDELTIGRFQVRVAYGEPPAHGNDADRAPACLAPAPIVVPDPLAESPARSIGPPPRNESGGSAPSLAAVAAQSSPLVEPAPELGEFRPVPLALPPTHALGDSVAQALREQFAAMQQRLVDHTQQMLGEMARVVSEMQTRQLNLIRDELLHVQEVKCEVQDPNFEIAPQWRDGSDADIDMLPPQPGEPAETAFGRQQARLCERIDELEQECSTRWREMTQFLAPSEGGDAN